MFKLDDRGVTPVIGTIMILGIMVVGIGGILLWGAPAIQAVQDQGSLAAMEGEFASLRANTDELRVRDSTRLPVVSLATGEIGFSDGTRTALQVATVAGCDPHLMGGWLAGQSGNVTIDATGCTVTTAAAHIFGSGENKAISVNVAGSTVTIELKAGFSASSSSWRFTLYNGATPVAYAFVLETNQLDWSLDTQSSQLNLFLEGGAMFLNDRGQVNLLGAPPIYENLFGSGDYVLKMPIYVGPQVRYGAPATLQAQFTLGGNTWSLGSEVHSLRYDYSGDLAEAWCNTLLLRNDKITTGAYAEDAGFTCETGSVDGVRSVEYTATTTPYNFELMTPRINAALFL